MKAISLIIPLIGICSAIELKDVGVPHFAVKGQSAVLSCDYDLQGQQLYAIKWYKNGHEFYRFVPANPDPMTVYARSGVNVDRARSNDKEILLTDLTLESTGRYRCEVSTEGPSFATVSNYGDMVIVGKRYPRLISGPRILGSFYLIHNHFQNLNSV